MGTAPSPLLNLTGVPNDYREAFSKSRSYIANISTEDYHIAQTYGNYMIPGRKAGEEFSLIEITPRSAKIDMGDNRSFYEPISTKEIADDICRMINSDAGGEGQNSFLGVFVCGKDGPTKHELSEAHKRLEKFYAWCVQQGDVSWQRYHQIIMIPDLLKRAANYLKAEREWAAVVHVTEDCPGCGSPVKQGVALCKGCGCVIDRKKALELGLIQPIEQKATAKP